MKKIRTKEQTTRNYLSKCPSTPRLNYPSEWLGRAGKVGQALRMTSMGRLGWIVLNQLTYFIIVVALISGCGYSTKSLISRKVDSIYIPVFDNTTFRRGLEFELTKAVKDEIMSKTNLKIVQKDSADTILNGTITSVTEGILTQDITDNIVESRLTIHVDIKLVDRRTDRVLISESDLKGSAEFIVKRGETIESAAGEGLVSLAETIVDHLQE